MKIYSGTLNLGILIFSILGTIFTSCNGQSAAPTANSTLNSQNSIPPTEGDTFSAIDKNIWIVFQDKNDNYWFGSDGQGVYRYDGKTVRHFTVQDGLCNNRIREIQEDKSGNIFISTLDGISKFDGQKLTTLIVAETGDSGDEWRSAPDDLWFKGNSVENVLYRYDGSSLHQLKFPKHYMEDEFYKTYPNASYSPYGVYTIYRDSKGNLWFGTSCFGICRFDGKTLSWMYEKHLTETPGGGSFGIRSIIEDKKGKFWFCNTRYRYDISPGDSISQGYNFIKYRKDEGINFSESYRGEDPVYFQYILEDNKRDLWMSTYMGGVWKYDGDNMTHYPVRDGAGDIKIISIYKDNHGGLWLGTQEKGAYKFNGKTFERFKP